MNQDGQTNLADATAFGFEFNGPHRVELADINADGQVNLTDATVFGQVWNGTSDEQHPGGGGWLGTGLGPTPDCACGP